MSPRTLLVEDEPDIAGPLVHYLRGVGQDVVHASTGSAALAAIEEHLFDLVLLDLMLPDVSGLEVCRRLRSDPRTAEVPIVMLTARGDEYDKIVGFESGADDYVTKPFSLRELTLRVQALLRRARPRSDSQPPAPERVQFGELVLDTVAHRASVGASALDLTVVEFRMLATFLEQRGRALTRDDICLGTWGEAYAISERAVDTNVKRLRRKLGEAGRFLSTVRGVGYRWAASPDEVT